MPILDVGEAARRLGVSERRVRQLIRHGGLEAVRIGRSWALDVDAVARRQRVESPVGRPYAPARAWQLASAADAILQDPDGRVHLIEVKSAEDPGSRRPLSRAHWRSLVNLLAGRDLDEVGAMLRSRARSVEYRFAHPSLIERLAHDDRLMLSGVRASAERGADIVPDERVDAYLRESDVVAVEDEYSLQRSDRGDANVCLRVVGDDALPRDVDVAPLLFVAADLRDREDARARDVSEEIFARLRQAVGSRAR